MTPKERQENSKREIFRAAMEEFGTKEYETVTMEGICAGHKMCIRDSKYNKRFEKVYFCKVKNLGAIPT